MNLLEEIRVLTEQGYDRVHAEARVCQDVILQGIADSSLRENVTIKGGVVMRSLSKNARRATMDLDIDFIRYSLNVDTIKKLIAMINCVSGLQISQVGEIEPLKHQDYQGNRVFIQIVDEYRHNINSKIDIGVHKNIDIEQEEYCFDICYDNDGASLLINSKEQMFIEKLRSLLRFGVFSTRYKDIFDIYYLREYVDKEKLKAYIKKYIIDDPNMKEKTMSDILKRVRFIFENPIYVSKMKQTNTNWLDEDISNVFRNIEGFLNEL